MVLMASDVRSDAAIFATEAAVQRFEFMGRRLAPLVSDPAKNDGPQEKSRGPSFFPIAQQIAMEVRSLMHTKKGFDYLLPRDMDQRPRIGGEHHQRG